MDEAKIIALMNLMADADGVVFEGELNVIHALKDELGVVGNDIKKYAEMGVDELVDGISAENLDKFKSEFLRLAKADGIVDVDELKIFNKMADKMFPG